MMRRPTRDHGHGDRRNSVDKAMELLQVFGPQGHVGVGVSELARRSRMSKSTAFRLLGILERNGAVERVGQGYRLGSSLHELGSLVYAQGHDRVRDLLTPFLAELYEATHETVHLAVLHGTDVVYLNKLHGHRTVASPSRIGGRIPAHATAVGKVLLACDDRAGALAVTAPLAARTPRTITDPGVLDGELAEIRVRGVALDRDEVVPGLSCVAAAVVGPDGRAVAAMSVSMSSLRFDHARVAPHLRRITHAAARALLASRARRAGPTPRPALAG